MIAHLTNQKCLTLIQITENYDLIIHAHGRRVFPESIGVHFIDHNLKSITEVNIKSLTPYIYCIFSVPKRFESYQILPRLSSASLSPSRGPGSFGISCWDLVKKNWWRYRRGKWTFLADTIFGKSVLWKNDTFGKSILWEIVAFEKSSWKYLLFRSAIEHWTAPWCSTLKEVFAVLVFIFAD